MNASLKNRYWRTVSYIKYTKSYPSIARTVKQNIVEGHMQKMNFVLEPGWISNAFESCEPEFYKLVTMVTHDDITRKIYTVLV